MIENRIKELREENNLTQTDLSKLLNISQSTLAKYETGARKPDVDMLNKLSNYFNKTIDYVIGNTPSSPLAADSLPANEKKVPIIKTVYYNAGSFSYEYLDDFVWVDGNLDGDIRAFHCKGDSMIGLGIFNGDIAIIRIQEEIKSGELAVVVVSNKEGTLRRIRRQDNVIILESADPAYPLNVFTGEEASIIHIVGKVLETRRRY
jgi:repressor LexA